ncbi:putative phage abortive infection protein [Oceanicaulis sp.]|uniref:putative phage abortive infection protein n=1 Tax=Oceanicaulis sp. TaxID=1924941 RepID=UPI003BAA7CA7
MKRIPIQAVAVSALIALLVVIGAYIFRFNGNPWSQSPKDWADFGAYVGGLLGPIIAMAALYYLYRGVKFQKEEMNIAIKEFTSLNENNKEKSMDDSLNAIITNYNDVLSSCSLYHRGGTKSGKEYFAALRDLIYPLELTGENFHERYEKIYNKYDITMGVYLRTIHNSLKYIVDNKMQDRVLSKLFIAQLSSAELFILLLNCLNFRGANMKQNAEDVHLFEHLSEKDRAKLGRKILSEFDIKAFGNHVPEALIQRSENADA